MRYPRTHLFLKWAGPAVVVFVGGCLTLIAAFAQAYAGVRDWAQQEFLKWEPVLTSNWLLALSLIVVISYIVALIYTGFPSRTSRWTARSLDGLARLMSGVAATKTLRRDHLIFDRHPATGDPVFLGLTRLGSDEPIVTSVSVEVTNNSGCTLNHISGHIQSHSSKQSFPLFLVCGGKLVEPVHTFGVPPGANFSVTSSLSHRDEIGEGVPASKFLDNFGGFEFVLNYDDASCTFHLTTEQCSKQIEAFKRQTGDALI